MAKGKSESTQSTPSTVSTLVPMVRETEDGGTATADVHPDEVANYAAGGWKKAK